ncbi:MAG: hypothetical protein O3A63_12925 [Proteobacteria bacterium]|nr:hypothetical protein [Pseudomonadota bacterium]
MSAAVYDRKRMRKAFLLAPAFSVLGVLPFLFNLNLAFSGFLIAILALTILCYLIGTIFGGVGYLILKLLNRTQSAWLIGYAVVLVVVVAIFYRDPYALLSLGPPALIGAGAFCWLRGPQTNPTPV